MNNAGKEMIDITTINMREVINQIHKVEIYKNRNDYTLTINFDSWDDLHDKIKFVIDENITSNMIDTLIMKMASTPDGYNFSRERLPDYKIAAPVTIGKFYIQISEEDKTITKMCGDLIMAVGMKSYYYKDEDDKWAKGYYIATVIDSLAKDNNGNEEYFVLNFPWDKDKWGVNNAPKYWEIVGALKSFISFLRS